MKFHTLAELRVRARGYPVEDLRWAIAAALPRVEPGLVALVAAWLESDEADPGPPLTAEQVGAVWLALQRRAH